MRSRKLRPSLVVTVSTLSAATSSCGNNNHHHATAPTPTVAASTATATTATATTATATTATSSKVRSRPRYKPLNAVDPKHRTIYLQAPGKCIVFDGSSKKVLAPGQRPPTIDVPCPPQMRGATWNSCVNGTVMATADMTSCRCESMGNPPPPPKDVPCPPPDSSKLNLKQLNPKDNSGQTIYRTRASKDCFVTVKPKKPPTSMQPPKTKTVACPAVMADPAFAQCAAATLYRDAKSGLCVCSPVFGNPPPMARWAACPKP